MDTLFEIVNAPEFRSAMRGLGNTALVLAIGLIATGLAFYGRTREAEGLTGDAARWALLFGTWRDSLIITLLYTAEAMLFRYSEFVGLSNAASDSLFQAPWLVQPVLGLCLHLLIFVVAAMRIIAISRWLTAVRNEAG